jgi:hypothetical protein
LNISQNVTESKMTTLGEKVYTLRDGSEVKQKIKTISRKEAEAMLRKSINDLKNASVSYDEVDGVVVLDNSTGQVVPVARIGLTLDRFDRLRNYEIEDRLLSFYNDSFVINEACPFNGYHTGYFKDGSANILECFQTRS